MKHPLFTAFLVVLLTGCLPYADHPLTDAGAQKNDPSVFGTWYWQDEHETGFVHIGTDETAGSLRVVMVDLDDDGSLDVSEFSGHTSSLEGNAYLNLKWLRPEGKATGFFLVKYRATEAALAIAIASEEVFRDAVEAGSLKGQVVREKWFSFTRVSADQEKLQRFVLARDPALFKEEAALRRLTLP